MKHVLVAGGGSGVGLEVVRLLRSKGVAVTALVRNADYAAALEPIGAQIALANALDVRGIEESFLSLHADAIVCTLGSRPTDVQRVDYVGVRNLVQVANKKGVRRFVLVTSFGCGDTRVAVPPPLLQKIGPALDEKDKAEQVLRQSGLDFTILRPGGLESEPATGAAVLTHSPDVLGGVTRADVAAAVISCLDSQSAIGQTFGVFDQNKVRAGTLVAANGV